MARLTTEVSHGVLTGGSSDWLAGDRLERLRVKTVSIAMMMSLVLLAGCQDKVMRGKITQFEPVLMTDEAGNRYVIKHSVGNTYMVMPIKSVK
jgi:hypothetical protein